MQTTLNVIASPGFNTAFSQLVAMELPAAVSFKLSRILKQVKEHRGDFETTRMALIQKHGKKDKKGNIQIDPKTKNYIMKSKTTFDKEYGDLLTVGVEISQIAFEELGDIQIKPEVLELLVGTVIQEPV